MTRVARSKCRSCHAPIIWGTTANGKKMPLDEAPAPAKSTDKLFVFVQDTDPSAPISEEIEQFSPLLHGGMVIDRYTSHWATCPNADDFRKRGR